MRKEHGPDRLIAAAQALGDRHQIRRDAILLAGMQRSRPAHAAHHFIENEEHAVAIANAAYQLEIIGHRRHRAQGCADDGLGHKGDDLIGAKFEDLVLQRLGGARRIRRLALARVLQAVCVARVDMMGFDQQRLELGAAPFVAAGRQRAQGVAVIALTPRDDVPAPGLTLLHKILTGHFEGRLDRLRSATHQIDMVETRRGILDQTIRQLLGDIGREEPGMRIGNRIELLVESRQDIGMSMAEAGYRGAPRCIDIARTVAVEQFNAFAADGNGHHGIGRAVKNMGHDDFLPPLGFK